MASHRLAVVLRNPLSSDEFLVLRQQRPPKFGDLEYDSFVDSDLWDLPSAQLNLPGGSGSDLGSGRIDLGDFDLGSALDQVSEQLGFEVVIEEEQWKLWKFVEEPAFGPGSINTVFVVGKLVAVVENLQESAKWMTSQSCLNLLLEVKPSSDRIGPLVVVGLLNNSAQPAKLEVPPTLSYQEYPPGVILVPMTSRTAKPFKTTNLIVFAPDNGASEDCGDDGFIARGDALIVDPGCKSECHEELMKIISTLPKKLLVFVTHHHHDHVDGLSIVQKYRPDAILLAHENTMGRIGKGDWSLGYTSVSGAEDICIGGQRLRVIFAPGHTDGHMALLHVSTNSLIVGDHCVGQGSAILDITSGGNMSEYFQSTYNFMELSPHALIPMHGRVNLWPKHMLCGYLKNRRSREASILKAIEDGAETLFEIVAEVYAGVDRGFWIGAASNVRLHVDHLALEDKLPKEFSVQKFERSCKLRFLSRWIFAYLRSRFVPKYQKIGMSRILVAGAVAGCAVFIGGRIVVSVMNRIKS